MAAAPAGTSVSKKPGAGIWIGLALILLSIVLGIVSIAKFVGPTLDYARAPSMPYPGTQSFNLEPGDYAVFDRVTSGSPRLTRSDIRVTSPSGSAVQLGTSSVQQEITENNTTYRAVAEFNAATSGSYAVTITSSSSGEARVGITAIEVGRRFGWIGILSGVLSFLCFVIGIIVLLVGIVRRSRWSRSQRPGSPSGPAYAGGPYPGPQGPYASPPPGPYGAPPPGPYGAPPPASYPPPGQPGQPRQPGPPPGAPGSPAPPPPPSPWG